ncbi:hypothetical protein NDU88_004748 [Pleurodeles waltl]|uniref:Uncharacterized protein n=1 Tax=Pleurodeles waltl TaxID=8319 RepID=A0AAV7WVN5_PLEWA|nr:hypothetical protein NDU88_004748 [Pleurodeles waltl]
MPPPLPQGNECGKQINMHRGGVPTLLEKEEDVAGEKEAKGNVNTEEDVDANTVEEQDRERQSGETRRRRDGREPETAWTKESCTEKERRAEEEQANVEKSGRYGGACHTPGGTWLNQLHDRLRGHLGPVLKWVGKKGGEEAKGPKHAGLGHEG